MEQNRWKGRGEGDEEIDITYDTYNYLNEEKLRL